jgi:hypothetical protein
MFTLFCWAVALLGWVILIAIILSLTGLQKKIFQMAGAQGGLVVTKTIKIPFVGTAEVASVAGQEITLKFKRQRK